MMAVMLGRPRQRKGSGIPHIPLNACVQEDETYNKSDIAKQWRFVRWAARGGEGISNPLIS